MIEARHLTKRYGADTLALDDVSFRVSAGEIYCLLGSAGAGKTTVVDLLLATSAPTHGEALIDGVNCAVAPLTARRLASFITPGMGMHESLSASVNVEFFAHMSDGVRVTKPSARNAMRSVGVAERFLNRPIRDLAKETQVLLWLAVSALRDTPALVLDEPTAGLDTHGASDVYESLRDFRERGKAILVATSDVALATQVADRVGLLSAGRKTSEQTRQEMLGRNLTQFYLEYAGHPATVPLPPGA